ncbi:hypothetical protein VB712_11625 [Spirulina sp. CCNP1310]|uniref:hypothetical protein n=1 Tax=Spirulina sp. CCNP1310 TaxID=3110249 RepID=UPI002B21E8E4|nr:hypothetical protein [Spirulina sp. CCNP1310]MEA5419874.1 hypothetical protein [Spirulina sp. CCNP1310]
MAYSDFKFHQVLQQFQLTLTQVDHLFAKVPEVEAREILTVLLRENTSLALDINTEKARSEMIIAPIL